jgi:hypothetical protein
MPRLSKFAYPDDAPIRGLLANIRLAYSQRILGAVPSPLASRPAQTATPAARDPNLGSSNHDTPRL